MSDVRKQSRILAGLAAMFLLVSFWQGAALAEDKDNAKPAKSSPSKSMPMVDADYRVGPGDMIDISVWKEPEVSSTIVIRPDGKISIPLINDLVVSGKTPMEMQALIAEKLSPFIKSPNVTVTVKEVRSKKVYVLGQVNKSGSFDIPRPTTVLQILTEAGGLQPFAKQKSIYVLRNEGGAERRLAFNYKDVVKGKKIEQNIVLLPGDTVVVP
jgi:polysaccharide biosynthesis/export protein